MFALCYSGITLSASQAEVKPNPDIMASKTNNIVSKVYETEVTENK